jgi:hypothetical protein
MAVLASSATFTMRECPFLLLDAYGKNTKSNLSQAERKAIKKRIPILSDPSVVRCTDLSRIAGYPAINCRAIFSASVSRTP